MSVFRHYGGRRRKLANIATLGAVAPHEGGDGTAARTALALIGCTRFRAGGGVRRVELSRTAQCNPSRSTRGGAAHDGGTAIGAAAGGWPRYRGRRRGRGAGSHPGKWASAP
jgi:hypothetical protein